MSYGAQEAEAITGMAIRTSEMLLKLGLGGGVFVIKTAFQSAVNLAAFLAAAKEGRNRPYGRKNLKNLLSEGKKVELYRFNYEEYAAFRKGAKKYGIEYTSVKRDRADKDGGIYEVLVKSEDSDRLKNILDRIGYAALPCAEGDTVAATPANINAAEPVEELINKMLSDPEKGYGVGYDFSFAGGTQSSTSGNSGTAGSETQKSQQTPDGKQDTVRVQLNSELLTLSVTGFTETEREKMINLFAAVEQSDSPETKGRLADMLHMGNISLFTVAAAEFDAVKAGMKEYGIESVAVYNPDKDGNIITYDIAVKETDAARIDRIISAARTAETTAAPAEKPQETVITPQMTEGEKTAAARNIMPKLFTENPAEAATEQEGNAPYAAQSKPINERPSVKEKIESLECEIAAEKNNAREELSDVISKMFTDGLPSQDNTQNMGFASPGIKEDISEETRKIRENLTELMQNINRGGEGIGR